MTVYFSDTDGWAEPATDAYFMDLIDLPDSPIEPATPEPGVGVGTENTDCHGIGDPSWSTPARPAISGRGVTGPDRYPQHAQPGQSVVLRQIVSSASDQLSANEIESAVREAPPGLRPSPVMPCLATGAMGEVACAETAAFMDNGSCVQSRHARELEKWSREHEKWQERHLREQEKWRRKHAQKKEKALEKWMQPLQNEYASAQDLLDAFSRSPPCLTPVAISPACSRAPSMFPEGELEAAATAGAKKHEQLPTVSPGEVSSSAAFLRNLTSMASDYGGVDDRAARQMPMPSHTFTFQPVTCLRLVENPELFQRPSQRPSQIGATPAKAVVRSVTDEASAKLAHDLAAKLAQRRAWETQGRNTTGILLGGDDEIYNIEPIEPDVRSTHGAQDDSVKKIIQRIHASHDGLANAIGDAGSGTSALTPLNNQVGGRLCMEQTEQASATVCGTADPGHADVGRREDFLMQPPPAHYVLPKPPTRKSPPTGQAISPPELGSYGAQSCPSEPTVLRTTIDNASSLSDAATSKQDPASHAVPACETLAWSENGSRRARLEQLEAMLRDMDRLPKMEIESNHHPPDRHCNDNLSSVHIAAKIVAGTSDYNFEPDRLETSIASNLEMCASRSVAPKSPNASAPSLYVRQAPPIQLLGLTDQDDQENVPPLNRQKSSQRWRMARSYVNATDKQNEQGEMHQGWKTPEELEKLYRDLCKESSVHPQTYRELREMPASRAAQVLRLKMGLSPIRPQADTQFTVGGHSTRFQCPASKLLVPSTLDPVAERIKPKVIDLDDSDDLQSVGGTEDEGREQQNRVEMHENALSRLITSCNEFTRTVTGTTDQHALVNFLDLPPGATNSRMPLSSVSSMSLSRKPAAAFNDRQEMRVRGKQYFRDYRRSSRSSTSAVDGNTRLMNLEAKLRAMEKYDREF